KERAHMHRDTATACWYRRLDPACFTDQSSISLYADVGELAAPAFEARASRWDSLPSIAPTWGDAPPMAQALPRPLLSALADWLAPLAGLWQRPCRVNSRLGEAACRWRGLGAASAP